MRGESANETKTLSTKFMLITKKTKKSSNLTGKKNSKKQKKRNQAKLITGHAKFISPTFLYSKLEQTNQLLLIMN